MVIGDMPAMDDDRLDMVWADNSGAQVVNFLQKAGHNLDRVWMTKLAKCRPRVRGRKPTTSEYNTCRDEHLRKEIMLIQPKVVILVGAPSLRAFNLMGNGSINSIHGRVFEEKFAGWDDGPTFKVVPTLNPATFFYRPNKKLQARIGHDYLVAKDLLDGKEASDHFVPDWELIDSPEKLEWLKDRLLNSTMFGWDTESAGLSLHRAPVISYQFAWGWDECAVLPIMLHDPDAPEEQEFHLKQGFGAKNDELVTQFMRDVFKTPNIAKSAHNHKFDVNVLRWGYGVNIEGFLYDTWTMKHLQDEVPPSTLEFLCDLEFGWGDYSAEKRAITGSGKKLKASYDKVPDAILWPYGATDALGTYRLTCLYADRLKKQHQNLWDFHTIESEPLQRSLARAEYKGALVHTTAMGLLNDRFSREQKTLLTRLRGASAKPDFNPNSDTQVLAALLTMGVKDVELEENRNASGYSTDKQKLNDLVESNKQPQADFAADMITYRNRTKMISTYLENCKEDLDSDGRVRYSWVIAGPVTGRLSCRFFHQIPKIDESIVCYGPKKAYVPFAQRLKDEKLVMRDMFIAPEGYKYVYGDFSQVELRIMAIEANDLEMLNILSDPKQDLHTATAFEFIRTQWADMKESDVSKANRTEVGKRVNFGLAYGSEGYSLVKTGKWYDANGIERNFTWDMLNAGMASWKERFSGVGRFIDLTPDNVRAKGGIATNVFGRERHFGTSLNAPNEWERGKAERECVNFFIQSVAASLTNRTIIVIDKMLAEYDIGEDVVCLVNTVHDSVAYEVKDSHVEWFMKALEAISQTPYPELGNAVFKIDCGYGQNWTDAERAA
jgi:uracil-DNA glycosylase family 4